MTTAKHLVRLVTLLAALPVLIASVPGAAGADMRIVNCGGARRLANALRLPAGRQLTIVIQGACTENLVITRDDVMLQGQAGASIAPADATRATIQIDGARRVRIENLTVTGGEGAVVGRNGALFEVGNVTATGGTRFGIIASFGSTGAVDGSTVQNVNGDGVVAANNSSIVITNSTVRNNTGSGISGVRAAHVRVGQDASGTAVVRPVTVADNGANGISVADSSAAIVVGGSVTGSGRSAISVGRGSSGQIGVGANGLFAGTSVQNNHSNGVFVAGASATILGSTISGNARRGIIVENGGSARIGIKTDNSAYLGNTIANNGRAGILVSTGASAFIGGNTISGNGTDTSAGSRFGVDVFQASAILVGDNTISGHPHTGVFVSGNGSVRIGDSGFGLSSANTISGNGTAGTGGNFGGIYAFRGGAIQAQDAIIEHNVGQGAAAYEHALIELREGTVVRLNTAAPNQTGSAFDAGHGIIAGLRSTVRLRDAGTAVQDNAGDGVQLFGGSGIDFRTPPSGTAPVSVTGNAGFGLRCFTATNYSGDVTGVTGNTGGGNFDAATSNVANCTRF